MLAEGKCAPLVDPPTAASAAASAMARVCACAAWVAAAACWASTRALASSDVVADMLKRCCKSLSGERNC